MPLRVIAGTAKGRRLQLVPGDSTRPIMDRVKEALFSILGARVLDANFLDLFSGTGSVGIEALSRGAQQSVFVEMNTNAVKTIQKNLEVTGLGDRAVIRKTDVFKFLNHKPNQIYQYIYIAPPQYQGLWRKTLETLDKNPAWISPETTVIVQIDPKEHEEIELTHLQEYSQRKYGKTLLWFFEPLELDDEEEEGGVSDG